MSGKDFLHWVEMTLAPLRAFARVIPTFSCGLAHRSRGEPITSLDATLATR